MITYIRSILNSQYDTPTKHKFSDETEVAEFAAMAKAQADSIKEGKRAPRQGDTIDVELQGGELHFTEIFQLFPSWEEHKCQSCKGMQKRCPYCDGEGWDMSGEPSPGGIYVAKVQIGMNNSLFMLVRDEVWEEFEESETDTLDGGVRL